MNLYKTFNFFNCPACNPLSPLPPKVATSIKSKPRAFIDSGLYACRKTCLLSNQIFCQLAFVTDVFHEKCTAALNRQPVPTEPGARCASCAEGTREHPPRACSGPRTGDIVGGQRDETAEPSPTLTRPPTQMFGVGGGARRGSKRPVPGA